VVEHVILGELQDIGGQLARGLACAVHAASCWVGVGSCAKSSAWAPRAFGGGRPAASGGRIMI
jgi:hypothetical protein